jgi:hypothetical protein
MRQKGALYWVIFGVFGSSGVPEVVSGRSKITQNWPKSSKTRASQLKFWGHGVFGKDCANHFGEIGIDLSLKECKKQSIFGPFQTTNLWRTLACVEGTQN